MADGGTVVFFLRPNFMEDAFAQWASSDVQTAGDRAGAAVAG